MDPRNLSLRTELILLLVPLVLVATASTGSIAYRASRALIAGAAVREVGTAANDRRQALVDVLNAQRARAAALLRSVSVSCAPEETRCVRKVLGNFLATERAAAVELRYRNRAPIDVGSGMPETPSGATAGNLARFEFDQAGQPYYLTAAQTVTRDGPMTVTLRGDMHAIDQIFHGRGGLGQTGETFLTDGRGALLTPLRDAAPGALQRMPSNALDACLSGRDAEVLDRSYRGVPVIHGFRSIPEIGGGCAVAFIDQAEAFAPASSLRRDLIGISASLAALAIACSILFAQVVSRPMAKLSDYARSLEAGDSVRPVPTGGPAEVRTFSQIFAAMTHSLNASRTALEETTARLRNILESISESFIAVDRSWRCTYANRNAATLIRQPQEALPGRNLWELVSLSPNARAELERAMRQRVPVHFEEFHEPFDAWFEVDVYPTTGGLAVFADDVTERKRLNERLQQTHKLESLGVLAGGIAHDFNNLLTGILGNASLALEDLGPEHPARASLQNVVSTAERAAVLTRQLLAYAGKGRFVIQPLDLSALVREIGSLLETSMPRTVRLDLRLNQALPPIEGDAAQIQQLIMNLVINAAEAIGAHTAGTVTVSTSLRTVDETYIQQTLAPTEIEPGTYIVLEVEDTGTGMDEATLSRIFDPFFSTKFAGRGLGLAATLGIVRGHKGALTVRSAPGQGSHFTVLLPAGAGEALPAQVASSAQTARGRGTILVIDDEEVVRQTTRSILERLGYRVMVAKDGLEGVDLFRDLRGSVDLVLLDLTMPAMPGEEALERLKAISPDVPVLLSSGYSQSEAMRRFTGKPLAGFLEKPFTAADLAEQVRLALGG